MHHPYKTTVPLSPVLHIHLSFQKCLYRLRVTREYQKKRRWKKQRRCYSSCTSNGLREKQQIGSLLESRFLFSRKCCSACKMTWCAQSRPRPQVSFRFRFQELCALLLTSAIAFSSAAREFVLMSREEATVALQSSMVRAGIRVNSTGCMLFETSVSVYSLCRLTPSGHVKVPPISTTDPPDTFSYVEKATEKSEIKRSRQMVPSNKLNGPTASLSESSERKLPCSIDIALSSFTDKSGVQF